ncbi:MAG: 2,3-bisphosphoglycerate-independent phosphoglycerate mutase [Desulfovibrio sp.]|jgi:2,3-bisphosphoglycerate-independent phosphoglycerate mutase|nr:2,3-bisphosphoglycerate-independent phosphoglycerate mutase [Desulfovibrio sp.]
MTPNSVTPTLLLIMDGWGIAPAGPGNATHLAATPNLDTLAARCPHSRLIASGRDVGLPTGYIGNSEVGHLNIGAGRVVYQDMTRIDLALEDGSFAVNPVLRDILQAASHSGGRLHFIGLLSDGGVHSHIAHLKALCTLAAQAGVPARLHLITDGRDTDPKGGLGYVQDLEAHLAGLDNVRTADITGRFYAMDRDKHWERIQVAWEAIVHGKAELAASPAQALQASYAANATDEFVQPVRFDTGDAPGIVDGDAVFLFNFRADRMRELCQTLTEKNFDAFERGHVPRLAAIASMTPYDAHFTFPVAFAKAPLHDGLGETVSRLGLRQLRLAETEKYAHVTYFFNGGIEDTLAGEDRILVDSPRDVPTYDLKPAMSAREVTAAFETAWGRNIYDLVVCNLANGDMVGHTGVLPAAVEACTVVDECVGRMLSAVEQRGGNMLIIADHGNCETMLTPDGRPHTAHTTNPVPCILSAQGRRVRLEDGRLADVAPTLLSLVGLPVPQNMTGRNLVAEA